MNRPPIQLDRGASHRPASSRLQALAAALLLIVLPAAMQPQSPTTPQAPAATPAPTAAPAAATQPASPKPSSGQRRRAAKLYLQGSKLYLNSQFEQALNLYRQAALLDPANADYPASADIARSHFATSLIQAAAKARLSGDNATAHADLTRAFITDPHNPSIAQHLVELSSDLDQPQAAPLYEHAAATAIPNAPIGAAPATHSFHVRTDARLLIQQVFQAYGITAMLTDTVPPSQVRFDVDDADFKIAMRLLSITTDTFYVSMGAHLALVARDTPQNRTQYMRQDEETVFFAGLSATELADTANLAKNVFGVEQVTPNAATSSLSLRGAPNAVSDFNTSMNDLLEGRDQVMLDVRVLQIRHLTNRATGIQPPQSISAFNVYAEEQSILNANQALVQQIISSGLASPGDTLAILGILLASGQVSSSLFSGGLALFGGGLTQSALSPSGPATLNFNLNSSDTRALDNAQLRLGDNEVGSIKVGTRYPIQTSSYSSLSGSIPNIPGLTGAGSSSSLSSLLSSLAGSSANIPMIQYQDLGLTLKVTPKVLRNDEVALSAELSMDGLSGNTINGNPILNHQAFTGVVTLKDGEAAELASELDESQSRALSGTPGLSDVPGLNNISSKNIEKNYATLLIILTPHIVRTTHEAGPTPQMIIERGLANQ